VNYGIDALAPPERLEQTFGALDIGVERIEGRCETRLWIALGRKVKNEVRTDLFDDVLKGDVVVKIASRKMDAGATVGAIHQVPDVVEGTTPPAHTVQIPVRLLKQVICEMRTDHAAHSGNQGPGRLHDSILVITGMIDDLAAEMFEACRHVQKVLPPSRPLPLQSDRTPLCRPFQVSGS